MIIEIKSSDPVFTKHISNTSKEVITKRIYVKCLGKVEVHSFWANWSNPTKVIRMTTRSPEINESIPPMPNVKSITV